ncbi:hypothetical protein AB0B31_10945 [Catellatospora citrea]|uniref:hypothetical protein n=1 Tax=Catellatospora citrea TaxID=53366 RepID=UPI00340982BD
MTHPAIRRLRATLRRIRRAPDEGAFSTEYAIGVGLAAALVLVIMAIYRQKVMDVVNNWDFF